MAKLSFANITLLLLNISFILVDWRLGIMTFGDVILIIVFGLLFLYNLKNSNFLLSRKQVLLIITVIALIALNILLNLFFNINFSYIEGLQGLVKVPFYLLTIMLLFNYLYEKKLQEKLLDTLALTAVLVSLVGIYIMLAIYLNGILPYEFLWEFTRQDLHSYTYRGWDRNLIRMRSIFSEPSHLGFYLNTVIAILYFNKTNYKIKKWHEIIIILSIILTFSYSSILIFIGIFLMNYFNLTAIFSFIRSKRNLLIISFILIATFLFSDTIEKTIIIRTQEILSGADGSGSSRLQGSWSYINFDYIFLGNGIGNTPPIWNIYAYILSDLGLLTFLLYLVINIWLLYLNPKLAMVFIALGFQKGGYLGPGYWIFILLIFFFVMENITSNKKDIKIEVRNRPLNLYLENS